MLLMLPQNPIKAIPILFQRFKMNYDRSVSEREDMIKTWHENSEKNFYKSLDHRSFHFKSYEKKQQQAKAYIVDIKAIQCQPDKTKNREMLCGGSKNCEFFCTYAQFEQICVFSDA